MFRQGKQPKTGLPDAVAVCETPFPLSPKFDGYMRHTESVGILQENMQHRGRLSGSEIHLAGVFLQDKEFKMKVHLQKSW